MLSLLVTFRALQSWGVAFIKICCTELVLCTGGDPGPADLARLPKARRATWRDVALTGGGSSGVSGDEGGVEVSKHGVKISHSDPGDL